MATTYLKFGNRQIAFGVSIKNSAKDVAKKAEAKAYAKETSGAYYLAKEFQNKVILISASRAREKIKTVEPGIALFAEFTKNSTNKNQAWLIKLDDDRACLQIISEGVPYSDELMDESSLGDALVNKYGELQMSDAFNVYMTPGFSHSTGSSFPDASILEIDQLVGTTDPVLFKMSPMETMTVTVVLGVTALLVFSIIGIQKYKQEQQDRERMELAVTNTPFVDDSKKYEDNIRRLLTSAGFTGDAMVTLMDSTFKDSKLSVAGWVMTSMACSASQCTQSFSNKNGTHASLRQLFESQVTLNQDQKTAVRTFSLGGKNSAIEQEKLPKFSDIETSMNEGIQLLNPIVPIKLNLSQPSIFGLEKDMKIEKIPAEKQVRHGTVEITGPLGIVSEYVKALPENIAVQSLEISRVDVESDVTFTVKGEYFVK
jgi:hypothetical protein